MLLSVPIFTKSQNTPSSIQIQSRTRNYNFVNQESPPILGYTDMVYDSESDRIILHGGQLRHFDIGSTRSETWGLDINSGTWSLLIDDPLLRRTAHAMAYDSESDRVILFAGGTQNDVGSFVPTAETWSYDYNSNNWTNLNPIVSPPARYSHQMIYDEESDRVISFGGVVYGNPAETNSQFFADTWAYDFNTNLWTNMSPSSGPKGVTYSGFAYDTESDRGILFGGCESVAFYDVCPDFPDPDTWAYDYNTNSWNLMNPLNQPDSREYHELVYDRNTDRIIMFGGTPYNTETWNYDYNMNLWTQVNTDVSPPSRDRFAMAYDQQSDLIVLYGGLNSTRNSMYGDTWVFEESQSTWIEKSTWIENFQESITSTSTSEIQTSSNISKTSISTDLSISDSTKSDSEFIGYFMIYTAILLVILKKKR